MHVGILLLVREPWQQMGMADKGRAQGTHTQCIFSEDILNKCQGKDSCFEAEEAKSCDRCDGGRVDVPPPMCGYHMTYVCLGTSLRPLDILT